ncbi:MAG: GNAT family N-acetyltransferase [Bacilli bacterium]|jgi:predicted GNAT family N-acyltransferase|nr:GNAT family N-acetyltransferase [Bacilli bacterium]MDY0064221.1 GNAT family N-acetyltransferase [Bacilli bacterium]
MIKICKKKDDLIDSYILRKKVFIDEQQVSYPLEFDLEDKDYEIYILVKDTACIATARYKIIDDYAKIGRVCVDQAYRGKHFGLQLMKKIIRDIFKKGITDIILESQVSAIPFYEQLGFQATGPVFLDAGIKHRKMTYQKKQGN